ncbi:MAG: neutral/alkaline non-lysosomal ceramidase N-terminal domain-containing protein [Opitutaceae bacterium]|nr:neutral/alkaline non-lysosomal ceramidase N-terminal domain-containing protein [Opitutaceae bacterium]
MPKSDIAAGLETVQAGAAVVDITPAGSVFLYGYPHVPRNSTGVHDPLECAALYLRAGEGRALFLANDLIFFDRDYVGMLRQRITAATGIPPEAVMISATHTHSGPVVADNLTNAADSVVPKADSRYLEWLAERIVQAARNAVGNAEAAVLGFGVAKADGVGTNRHDPLGPSDPDVPVLLARSCASGRPIACMLVYGMHPTVLHEDSTLISADFPGFTRRWLRKQSLGESCPVIYQLGAAGDQSPRHVTKANTFAEAQRIGEILGRCIATAIEGISCGPVGVVRGMRRWIDVQPRKFPEVQAAREGVVRSRKVYEELRTAKASRQAVRTAECDVFGAEKTALLSEAAADGRLEETVRSASPAEIQVIQIGDWRMVGWPGEFFVEHALALKSRAPVGTHVITLANGQLQGYIATPKAVESGYYEATNAVFSVENGPRFVEATLDLIAGRR